MEERKTRSRGKEVGTLLVWTHSEQLRFPSCVLARVHHTLTSALLTFLVW